MTVSPRQMRKLIRIVENAEYDRGHGDISQTNSIGGQKGDFETTMKGRADLKTRRSNSRYGNNPMEDPILDEDGMYSDFVPNQVPDPKSSIIDRIQSILQKAGISDDDIRSGVDLTPVGRQKVAAQMGISADEVPMLLGSLTTRLRDEEKHSEEAYESRYASMMDEDDESVSNRFGYEKDYMGNVTVRDSQTGKDVYLQGSEASDLITRLEQEPESEQAILGDMEPLMEEIEGEEIDEETDFRNEMHSTGTFNFLWHDNKLHGTGTARYRFQDGDLKVSLISVRDAEGLPMKVFGNFKQKLIHIAHDFIVNEEE